MSENQTYNDQDGVSYLEVRPGEKGALRLEAVESDGDVATVDLGRADVERLVEQAQQWLKETKPKPPTAPGSVVRVPLASSPDLILTRLNDTGIHLLDGQIGDPWVSQYGTFWSDHDLDVAVGSWEVVHDAGVEG